LCQFGVESEKMPRELANHYNVTQVDEIWALYSVPYYLETQDQIKGVFHNAQKLLAPGGKFRIAPLALYVPDNKINDQVYFQKRLSLLIEELQKIDKTGEFNIYLTENDKAGTLIIEKVSQTKNEPA